MMKGGPEMRGARSFSTMSFDGWLGIETGPSDRGDLAVTVTAIRKGKVIPIEVTLQSPKANVPPQPKTLEIKERQMEMDKPHSMGR
jgi:hypothetical protein